MEFSGQNQKSLEFFPVVHQLHKLSTGYDLMVTECGCYLSSLPIQGSGIEMDRNRPLSKRNSYMRPIEGLCKDWQALRKKLDNSKAGDTASGWREKQAKINRVLPSRFSPAKVFAPSTCHPVKPESKACLPSHQP